MAILSYFLAAYIIKGEKYLRLYECIGMFYYLLYVLHAYSCMNEGDGKELRYKLEFGI